MIDSLTIYTLPDCIQCTLTKRALDAAGLPYTVVDLTRNEHAVTLMKQFGYTAAPVVIASLVSWSGFRPDWIAAIVAARNHPALSNSKASS